MCFFGADGFGSDELRYADNGRLLDTLNIQWDAFDDTASTSRLRPGSICRANCAGSHIRRGMQTTDLYIGGRYYDQDHALHALTRRHLLLLLTICRILRESGDFHYSLRVTPEI